MFLAKPALLEPGALAPLPSPTSDNSELVAQLADCSAAVTPGEFLAVDGAGLRVPGLYGWWTDESGAADLSQGLGIPIDSGLVYADLAGATRVKSRRKSTNTLWGRIKGTHLGGRHEFSTFRLRFGSVLAEVAGESEINEDALTTWMHEHLRVIAIPVDDADTLGEIETLVLAAIDPPLKLAKMVKTDLRRQLSVLRRS